MTALDPFRSQSKNDGHVVGYKNCVGTGNGGGKKPNKDKEGACDMSSPHKRTSLTRNVRQSLRLTKAIYAANARYEGIKN